MDASVQRKRGREVERRRGKGAHQSKREGSIVAGDLELFEVVLDGGVEPSWSRRGNQLSQFACVEERERRGWEEWSLETSGSFD